MPMATEAQEVWRTVVGFDGLYEVSDIGRVRSKRAEIVMKHNFSGVKRDYAFVPLSENGHRQNAYIHHLVAQAFIGPPPGRIGRGSNDWQCNHKNGNKSDNRPENLEWLTHKAHIAHSKENFLGPVGEKAPSAKLNATIVRIIRRCGALGITHEDIGLIWGVGRRAVDRIIKRERWAHI